MKDDTVSRFAGWIAVFATAAAATAGPASAQQASYCNGALQANSFYSNVLPVPGGGAEVEYHALIQNMDRQRRSVSAVMLRVASINSYAAINQLNRIDLRSYEQKDVVLLKVRTSHPGGSGAPSPMQVGRAIGFTCSFG